MVSIEPGLRRVGERAADRLERNGLRATGRLALTAITQEEIGALSGLLGARWRAPLAGANASVDLAALDAALRVSAYDFTLLELAAVIRGAPLVDRRAARLDREAARTTGWDALARHTACTRRPELNGWLERERATGSAVRQGQPDPFRLLRTVLDLVDALPAEPPRSLVRFATEHCGGDPHALDRDRPLDAVLRRALAHLDDDAVPRGSAAARRERYDRWGLTCDTLSGTVLALGLAPPGDGVLERSLRLAADAGEPRVLTLRELRAVQRLVCDGDVFTCENPDVIESAAECLGSGSRPLICTEGWPSTACLHLLEALRAGGASVHHHGDMDHDGLRIVDHLLARTNGQPWQMTVEAHAAHAEGGVLIGSACALPVRDERLRPLAEEIVRTGRLVREEQVVGDLLDDLLWRS